jgi:hypothetical protein
MHALRYMPPEGEEARKALELELDAVTAEPEWVEEGGYQFTANAIAFAKRLRRAGPVRSDRPDGVRRRAAGRWRWRAPPTWCTGLVIQDHKTKFSHRRRGSL